MRYSLKTGACIRRGEITDQQKTKRPGSVHQSEADTFKKLLTDIPKAEIHLHLEGLASVDTIWALMNENKVSVEGINSREELQKRFQVKSLDEFISLFINVIQNCFKKDSDFDFLIRDARDYLKRNNIVYAEIFFAPTKFLLNGFHFDNMIRILDEGAERLKLEDGLNVNFIIDVSRSYGIENAKKNFELTLTHRAEHIIGIGLGGAESQGPARLFKDIFQKARKNGLRVVAHAGEDIGPESIWEALEELGSERIGHGISAITDEGLMNYLMQTRTPLEICPTSNLFTRKFVKTLKEHPIKDFYDRGICVTVNTDDPTLFNIELIQEYMNLLNNGIFKPSELLSIVKNTVFATFQEKAAKDTLWKEIEEKINLAGFTIDS